MATISNGSSSFLEALSGTMGQVLNLTNVISKRQAEAGQRAAMEQAQFSDVQGKSKSFIDGYMSVKARADAIEFKESFSKELAKAPTVADQMKVVTDYETAMETKAKDLGGLFFNQIYNEAFVMTSKEMLSQARTSIANRASQEVNNDMARGLSTGIRDGLRTLASNVNIDATKLSADIGKQYVQLRAVAGDQAASEDLARNMYTAVLDTAPESLRAGSYAATLRAIGSMEIEGRKLSEMSPHTWNNYVINAMNSDNALARQRADGLKAAREQVGSTGIAMVYGDVPLNEIVSYMHSNGADEESILKVTKEYRDAKDFVSTGNEDAANSLVQRMYWTANKKLSEIQGSAEWRAASPSTKQMLIQEEQRRNAMDPEVKKVYDETKSAISRAYNTLNTNYIFRRQNDIRSEERVLNTELSKVPQMVETKEMKANRELARLDLESLRQEKALIDRDAEALRSFFDSMSTAALRGKLVFADGRIEDAKDMDPIMIQSHLTDQVAEKEALLAERRAKLLNVPVRKRRAVIEESSPAEANKEALSFISDAFKDFNYDTSGFGDEPDAEELSVGITSQEDADDEMAAYLNQFGG